MKVLAIGDIHGRDVWKKIDFEYYDEVIFVGDYLDSREKLSDKVILKNLAGLVLLQEKYQHIHFLIGNHDLQYTDVEFFNSVTGYRESYAKRAQKLLKKLKWKFAVQFDEVLYTHAGLHRKFYDLISEPNSRIADSINSFGFEYQEIFLFTIGSKRGGSAEAGSPIWCDYGELLEEENPLPINQVFGHTATKGGRIAFKGQFYRQCIDILTKYPMVYEIIDGGIPIPMLII
ncbi:metallophosphoesterase [Leptospira bouyouniensis]|uniref:Calcineurin-like phosphoesterase domain-containing protein n=1 Tax=Leptospira bouyouniensis TaxID=2484911 RepID=A0ABY2LDU8_9LEPT|nr:metallophosphoesterase [Leptospira bouyouniensis]TGK54253.1 hypothetical protein EHQ10_00365 [Leptospira bouyouniensis]